MKYHCTGFRPVEAGSFLEAAEIFARRLVRKACGIRNPVVGASRVNAWRQDGTGAEVDVFCGYRPDRRSTGIAGRNYLLCVRI